MSDTPALPATTTTPAGERLVSLDAYRGIIMLAMASGGFAFKNVYDKNKDVQDCKVMQFLAEQFPRRDWVGCSFWDLIQPSFMFMVGVSMAYSYAKRQEKGESQKSMLGHALGRSLLLIMLGVFLSTHPPQDRVTHFTFTNVLAQIGLGYTFLFLLWNRRWFEQLGAAALILGGYWLAMMNYSPPSDFQREAVGVTEAWHQEHEAHLDPHWHKNANFASNVDVWLLNRFPRPKDPETGEVQRFKFNTGGYTTLNFIPSLATMIFGLLAGGLLRSTRSQKFKFWMLVGGGLLALGVGWGVGEPVSPLIKRIWTPGWAVYCTGWTLLMLAGFYAVIDWGGWKRWTFPLVVVGMNSIAIYCMSQLLKPWITRHLDAHIGYHITSLFGPFSTRFQNIFLPPLLSASVLLVLWLICYWMYRQRFFVKI